MASHTCICLLKGLAAQKVQENQECCSKVGLARGIDSRQLAVCEKRQSRQGTNELQWTISVLRLLNLCHLEKEKQILLSMVVVYGGLNMEYNNLNIGRCLESLGELLLSKP